MCRAMIENGEFDPELCPLLQGLSPEEIIERIETSPNIRACSTAISNGSSREEDTLATCVAALKRENAERRQATGEPT